MDVQYREPINVALELLRDRFNGRLKSFYEGDPDLIPISNLPALTIEKISDDTSAAATGIDYVEEQLLLKVIFDKQDDYGANDDSDLTSRRIRKLIEERDPTTGQWLSQTIKGYLRSNLTLRRLGLQQVMSFQLLPEVIRSESLFTAEGHLTLTFRYRVPVPQRS